MGDEAMKHAPGTIVVVSSDLGRYTAFTQSFAMLEKPEGTHLSWAIGADICANLNKGLEDRIGEWVWFMGDDHVFGSDLLLRLLGREVPVVAPVVYKRKPPYMPLVFTQEYVGIWDGLVPVPREQFPSGGIHPYAACSGAGLLVRAEVFDALKPPYFECGQLDSGMLAEDIYFQRKVREAGYKLYIDFDVVLGHETPAVVWPVKADDGSWQVVVDPNCRVPGKAAPPTLSAA